MVLQAGLDACKILVPPLFEPQTIKPVVSYYTDYAILAATIICYFFLYHSKAKQAEVKVLASQYHNNFHINRQ